MINLRYHIVSITAVFLALGIGVTLGSSFIQRYTIDTLESRLNDLGDRLDRTDTENRMLRDELQDREQLEDQLVEQGPELFAGHLEDVPVLLLSVHGTDDQLLADTRRSLRAADADLSGTLTFTARWDDLSDDELDELAALIERPLRDEQAARNLVLRRVADELRAAAEPPPEPDPDPEPGEPGEPDDTAGEPGADPDPDPPLTPDAPAEGDQPDGTPEPPVEDTGPDDPGEPPAPDSDPPTTVPVDEDPPVPDEEIIDALIELGFLEFVPDTAALPLPAHGMRYALVVEPDSGLDPDAVVLRLLDALTTPAGDPAPLVVATPLVEEPVADAPDEIVELTIAELIARIRDDERLNSRISTVDHLDRFSGQGALVLSLAGTGDGIVGHHGLGEGSTSLIPARAA